MDTTAFHHNGDGRVVARGEVDMATAPELATILARIDSAVVTVDCSDLTFLDSSGISALIDPVRRGQVVRLVNAPPVVRRILDAAAVTEMFEYLEA